MAARMKRKTAPPTYDSESTETDEETVSMHARGATAKRVKREAPASVAPVAAPQEPRQSEPIPATSVLDLGVPPPPPPMATPSQLLDTNPPPPNSILNLLLAPGPPVVPAPVEVPQAFVHHQQYPVPPQYQQPMQPVPPPHYHMAPAPIVPREVVIVEPPTVPTSNHPIVIEVVDDDRCSMCELPFSEDTELADPEEKDSLKCACCQRLLTKYESFTKNQRTKPADEVRCKTCSRGGVDNLKKIRDRPGSAYSIEQAKREAEEVVHKEKLKIALEKRRATIARKKQEKLDRENGIEPTPPPVEVAPPQQPPAASQRRQTRTLGDSPQQPLVPPQRQLGDSPPQDAPQWFSGTAGSRETPSPPPVSAPTEPSIVSTIYQSIANRRPEDIPEEEALDAQVAAQGTKCGLCKQQLDIDYPVTTVDTVAGMRCACCQRKLDRKSFSHFQFGKEANRRCKACVDTNGSGPSAFRKTTRKERALGIVANLEKLRIALEKRRATIARKKLEKQQEEEEERRKVELLGGAARKEEVEQRIADRKQMEMALRNILRDHRSIIRRRAVNDLDGPYRETYELEMLGEEEKLHMQAVALRLENEVLYDEICRELEVVDGAVRYGERDFEQGENDGDKPSAKKQKRAKEALKMIESGQALLKAAKATAIRPRAEWNGGQNGSAVPEVEEPARTRAKLSEQESQNDPSLYTEKNSSPPPPMAITTRLRRRVAKPVHEVIEIDHSD